MRPYLKIKKLHPDAIIPKKRAEDAGYDMYGYIEEDHLLLKPGEIFKMPSGIAYEMPQDWVLFLKERSSTGSRGIAMRGGVGDSGYRGQVFVPLNNTSAKPILFYKDEAHINEHLKVYNLTREETTLYPLTKAIAQFVLLYCPHVDIEETDTLSDSQRGEGGFGSTGL